jgi:hypothetical protein
MRRVGEGVTAVVVTERGFGRQSFISVGMWLNELGSAPDRCALCHVSLRLERLVPHLRELILTAGDGGDPGQATALVELESVLAREIEPLLREVATVDGLREAIRTERISTDYVVRNARLHLGL